MRPLILFAILAGAERCLACATCTGPADDPQSLGLTAAILTLLGVGCAVFVTALTLIGVLAWRITHHQPPAAVAPATIEALSATES